MHMILLLLIYLLHYKLDYYSQIYLLIMCSSSSVERHSHTNTQTDMYIVHYTAGFGSKIPEGAPSMRYSRAGFFTQIRPVREDDLGSGEKNDISQVGAFI
jgi:hypothetical protein